MKGIKDRSSNSVYLLFYVGAILFTFAGAALIREDSNMLRLFARSFDATVTISPVFLFFLGFLCSRRFFTALVVINTIAGFAVLFLLYFSYSAGRVPTSKVLRATFVDFKDYLLLSLILLGFLGVLLLWASRRKNS